MSDEEVLYVRIPRDIKQRTTAAAKDLAIPVKTLVTLALRDYLAGFEEFQDRPVVLKLQAIGDKTVAALVDQDQQSGEES